MEFDNKETMELDTFQNASKFNVSRGFSQFHATLLDICLFQSCRPDPETVTPITGPNLTSDDLAALAKMILVEFAASLDQELGTGPNEEESYAVTTPHAYDVFLMTMTLGCRTSRLAVCIPMKGSKSLKGGLEWWDGCENFWPLESDTHLRRVASLSGSARILQALSQASESPMDSLTGWAMRRDMLVDIVDDRRVLSRIDSSIIDSMNESQRKAVITAVSEKFHTGYFAIQGPPGCGKTTTMVGMISAIGEGMIVTAPSNAAVANIALKLYETGRYKFPELVIFGDGCEKSVRFLNPRYRSSEYRHFREGYDNLGVEPDLTPSDEIRKDKFKRDFAAWLHVDEDSSIQELGDICPYVEIDDKTESPTSHGFNTVRFLMDAAKVIICTLNSSGSFFLQGAVDSSRFRTLMLDEGGQCTEAEFFIATTFPGIQRIIVMGDPNQLRPTVLEPACVKAGYGESWLGQVYKLSREKVHLLDTQYRMDPQILRFPNAQFYGKRIKSGENVLNRQPCLDLPFQFVDTRGQGIEERDRNFSFKNSYEATVIKNILKNDPDIKILLQKSEKLRIIIITPYKAQMNLLAGQIRVSRPHSVDVSTVDAFQGQEGDIVILSTVRTKAAGFVDDRQRLNVALTRAKRILRVVGDTRLFLTLSGSSTLRALANAAEKRELLRTTKLKSLAYCPPDLSVATLWNITMTSRFHHAIKRKDVPEKNIYFNTLFALATPDTTALSSFVRESNGWHISSLKGYIKMNVVWTAKKNDRLGIIEAHFAGNKQECLNFIQQNHKPPDASVIVKSDMSGFVNDGISENTGSGNMFVSWPLNNNVQNAIAAGEVEDLPQSMMQLDPPQERIACSPPPLLIESRSGTGKTLVLLQHAAFYARYTDSRPACFVTVSHRLKSELERKYNELTPILGNGLPKTYFFTFHELLFELLDHMKISDFENSDRCRFTGYLLSRKSHDKLRIEAQLIENEIGGVITGSLAAAEQRGPLTEEQYLADRRSNISNKTRQGRQIRAVVYDEYKRYTQWKLDAGKFDLNDIVLRLLKPRAEERPEQLFSSAYLDEVQDLSHAGIYLICSLAGRDALHWVCGGDPAQMISPGCSFTFDGLKQTLLAVQNGIEPKLRDVHHLVVNYRTTKDILVFGNSILATAKRVFPESIEFALPETARKDLGLKVVLCDWSLALQNQVIFGDNQAFIYSPSDSDTLRAEANEWLDDHPFILSALDAKGLEFDDVVVAFDLDRKVWDVDRRSEASLRMLRELYVAVTRAQRRVVVLVKKQLPSMHAFFNHLHCDFQNLGASTILQEFDRETTSEKWFERAQKLFQNDQFPIAASCFTKAARQDWSFLAQGHHLFSSGLKEEASPKFRRAVRLFNERCDFERVLDIMLLLLNILPWDDTDDTIFEEALHQLPHYLPRLPQLKYAISRGKWETIQLADFQDSEIAPVLAAYRKEKGLKKLVRSFEDQDRASIEEFLPFIVADYHSEKGDFVSACRIALRSSGYKFANDTTKEWLKQIQLKFKENEVDQMTDTWKRHKKTAMTCLHRKTPALLLLQVFDDPISTAKLFGLECIQQLGKQILRFALDQAKVDRVHLLDFSQKEFKDEVEGSILVPRFEPKLSSVVKWYLVNGYRSFASEFVKGRLKKLSSDDMIRIALDLAERPTWFFDELLCRDILGATIALSFFTNCMAREKRYQFRSDFDEFKERKGDSLPLKFDRILHGKKVSYTALIIAFGPTVTAYMRMHRGEHYDQELRIRVNHFYAELRTCLAERLEAEKKPNQTMSAKQKVQKEAADTNDCDRHQVDSKGFVEVKVMSKKAARKQKQQQQQAKKEAKKVQTATPSTQQKGKINQNKKKGKKKSGRK